MRLIDADKEAERLKKGYCEECTRKGKYGIFGAACTPCWVKDAVEEFENAETFSAECHGRFIDAELAHKMLMEGYDLRDVPSADVEPVRHGRWKGWTTSKFTGKYKDYDEPEFKDYVYYTCSECYRKSAIQELYCPQCGARMDGETE